MKEKSIINKLNQISPITGLRIISCFAVGRKYQNDILSSTDLFEVSISFQRSDEKYV